jgi:hypothetical protein
MRLNYDTLALPVTDADIKHYAAKETAWLTPRMIALVFVFFGGILLVPTAIGMLSSGRLFEPQGAITMSILATIVVGVVVGAIFVTKTAARETVRMRRFAEANGAILTKNGSPIGMSGLIFDNGHSRMVDYAYALPDGVELGNYRYTTGSGKNQTTHTFGYARVALGRNLPHMVLDAKGNNFFGSSLPDTFQASQRLSLEGNFNEYFDLYVPENYQRDALYIFTPDVMQALVDHGKDVDIEVVGNELYIYSKSTIAMTSKIHLQSWMNIVESISTELKDQSKRYLDERMSASQVAGAVMPEVATEGKRLKKSQNYVVIILAVAFVFVLFAPNFLPEQFGPIFVLLNPMTLLLIALAVLIRKLPAITDYLRRK